MARYIDLINDVFVRLRQPTLTAMDSDSYTLAVGAMVNQAKREVEDSYKWAALYREHTFNTVAGTATYSLTSWGQRFSIEHVIDADNDFALLPRHIAWITRQRQIGDDDQDRPTWWAVNVLDSNDDAQLELHHTPDAVYSMRVHAFVPQATFSSGTEVIRVPSWPVVLGAYALAISERGEDGGVSYDEAYRDYQRALNHAIAQESGNTARGHIDDWYVAYGPRA